MCVLCTHTRTCTHLQKPCSVSYILLLRYMRCKERVEGKGKVTPFTSTPSLPDCAPGVALGPRNGGRDQEKRGRRKEGVSWVKLLGPPRRRSLGMQIKGFRGDHAWLAGPQGEQEGKGDSSRTAPSHREGGEGWG